MDLKTQRQSDYAHSHRPLPQTLSFWIIKEKEMLNLNFDSMLVVTRLMGYYSWAEIKITLEDFFQASIVINPFSDDKALVKCNKEVDSKFKGHWCGFGEFHLKLEPWSELDHSLPKVISSYGGWVSIKNLPMPFWKNSVFEAIGHYLGGLDQISSLTLNFLDGSSALIKVKENSCGFILASLEIKDVGLGKFFIYFESKEELNS